MSKLAFTSCGLGSLLAIQGCSGSGPASDTGGAGAGPAIAAGTCAFEAAGLPVASMPTDLRGKGYATMNGSANAQVHCGDFDSEVDSLEISIGNGNYLGPGEYWLDPSLAHGSLALNLDEQQFSTAYGEFGSTCEVVVTEADERLKGGPSPPPGSPIVGTFECNALRALDESAPTIDLRAGAFSVILR